MIRPCPDAVPVSPQCPSSNPFEALSSEAFDGLDYVSRGFPDVGFDGPGDLLVPGSTTSLPGGPGPVPPLGQDWEAISCGVTYVSQISQIDADIQAWIGSWNCARRYRYRLRRRPFNPLHPPPPEPVFFLNDAQTACRQCPSPLVGSGCFTVPAGVILDISQAGADAFAAHVATVLAPRYRICFDLRGQASPPQGEVGVPYSFQLTCTGGTPPYYFYIVAGTLPLGLSLSSGGLISGTPSVIVTNDPVTFGVSDSTP